MACSSSIPSTAASFPDALDADARCPNCGGAGLRRFYEVRGVPVHSCLLMPTREAALTYPRGDLSLGFCERCGFVTNTAFDVADNDYNPQYEETQGFSPTFNAFARELAQQLVDRHDLAGRTVLEIGCGKGEFLELLCELGGCRGIGIDPAWRPDRAKAQAAGRVRFIQDLYDRRYTDLEADLILCRHTLEHIAPTGEFIAELRRTIGARDDVAIFFELPDIARVLDEGAFWDLYYEHCSYFSAGSLARVFRAAGFEVTSLELAYAGQYLLIEARPAAAPTRAAIELEDDLPALRTLVQRFPAICRAGLERWTSFVRERSRRGPVVLWGSGSKAVGFMTTLGGLPEIEHVVDINPYRHGHFIPGSGQQIVEPRFLAEHPPAAVIVMNPVYVPEITAELARLGVDAEVVAV